MILNAFEVAKTKNGYVGKKSFYKGVSGTLFNKNNYFIFFDYRLHHRMNLNWNGNYYFHHRLSNHSTEKKIDSVNSWSLKRNGSENK